MEYRRLGKYGLRLSEIGLGAFLTYGNSTSYKTAEACIDTAYALGINFFDNANAYAGGEAEKVVGRALAWTISTSISAIVGTTTHLLRKRCWRSMT